MSFKSIIGQPLAVELCQRWLAQDTTQPLLLYGPEGVGKKTTALELAKALNCPNPVKGDACDACLSCRKIADGRHPDVQIADLAAQALERNEVLEKQQVLRIETILNQRRRLLQSPLEGRWKVFILDDAHRLTADAANVLLKILEEPPLRTTLFLVTPFRDRLFPTILSRCQPVRFRPLTHEEMDRSLSLHRIPAEQRARLIELALGSPGRALHFNREEQIQIAQEAEHLWNTLRTTRPADALKLVEPRAKLPRNDVEEKIQHLMVAATREMRFGRRKAEVSLVLLQQAQKQLRANVSPRLVLEHLFIQLARERGN